MDEIKEDKPLASRTLSAALLAAAAAVLADLALVLVFLAIVMLALFIIAKNFRMSGGNTCNTGSAPLARWNPVVFTAAGILIALINGINLSRNAWMSERLFADVRVSVFGLTDEECLSLSVFQKNISEELENIPWQTNGWRFDRPHYYTGIQVEIPALLWPKVTSLQIQIGARLFGFSGPALRTLASDTIQDRLILPIPDSVSLKRSRYSPVKTSINWRGDVRYFVRIGEKILIVILIFTFLWLVLLGAGWLGEKLRLIRRSLFRPLAVAIWALTALIAVPIFSLQKSGQLYWGGKVGFLHDTVLGLIQDVFYRKSYVRGQEYIALGLLIGVGVLFLFLAVVYGPVHRSISSGPAFALLVLIFFAWGFYLVGHRLFGLPYPSGRTAIFFLPLAGLVFIFMLISIQAHRRFARVLSVAICAAALAAALHFAHAANVSFASEWILDADNKTLLSDLQTFRQEINPSDRTFILGILWKSFPPLDYYAEHKDLRWLQLTVLPVFERCDAYYLNEEFDPRRMVLLKRYPRSGHILVTKR